MEVLFAPLFFVVVLLFGPFIALNAYLLVWLCGPAIRRAGQRWEEGRIKAASQEMDGPHLDPMDKAWLAGQASNEQDPMSPADKKALKDSAQRYDAGHRWLG